MPTTVMDMLRAYPADLSGVDRDKLARAIEECVTCTQTCTACADACLAEKMIADMLKCIRTDLDCADMCGTTSAVLTRQTAYDVNVTRPVVQACIAACKACADECEQHAHMEHCRICAEVCRRCEQACNDLLGSLG
jgi:hypothetical protein